MKSFSKFYATANRNKTSTKKVRRRKIPMNKPTVTQIGIQSGGDKAESGTTDDPSSSTFASKG